MATENERPWRTLLLFHLVLLGAALCFFLYFAVTRALIARGFALVTCPLHDLAHIYCPLCGGSRALLSLLSLDFRDAVIANPPTVVLAVILLVLYIRAWVGYCRRRVFSFGIGKPLTYVILSLYILFFLVRNILLFLGIDPLGDFLPNG